MGLQRAILLAGVAALALAVVPVTLARAYVSVAYVTPTTMTDNSTGEGSVRATLGLGNMTTGEVHNLRSEIVVGNPRANGSPARVAVGHKITCQPVGGSTITNGGEIWNGQNLLANTADVTLTVRMLFIAPAAGYYECLLRAYLNDGLSPGDETASLKSGFIGDVDGAISPSASKQRIAATSENIFMGLGSSGQQINHLTNYSPPAGATSFDAVGDLYVTSCYGTDPGGSHCPAGTYPSSGTAQVYSRVVATPGSTASGCVAQATAPTTVPVTSSVHHYRILHKEIVTLPSSGCGTWTINIFARDGGGTLPFVVNTKQPYTVTYARPS
jgi:hypothetical protein